MKICSGTKNELVSRTSFKLHIENPPTEAAWNCIQKQSNKHQRYQVYYYATKHLQYKEATPVSLKMRCSFWKRLILATISLASSAVIACFTSTTRQQPHCRIRRNPVSFPSSPTQQPEWDSLSRMERSQRQCRLSSSLQLLSNSNPSYKSDARKNLAPAPSKATERRGRVTKIKRWVRRAIVSLSFASTVFLSRPNASFAASAGAMAAKQKTAISIRPGMSKTQVNALEDGDVSVMEQLEQAPSIFQTTTPDLVSKVSSVAVDEYGDEGGDMEDDMGSEDDFSFSSKTARQEDKVVGERLRASTSDQFAAYHQKKTVGLTAKVGLAFFGPTYGFMMGREYVRRRREEAYVKKGLEILEAQKAEYFNITGTSNDADVEDALKGLKNKNATNTDDEEDDDDDDEDDDEPEPPSSTRRTPRKPLGDPPKSGGDNDGSTGKSDNDKPSAADIDKLNKLLGKS
jgi:hypothetical protein